MKKKWKVLKWLNFYNSNTNYKTKKQLQYEEENLEAFKDGDKNRNLNENVIDLFLNNFHGAFFRMSDVEY